MHLGKTSVVIFFMVTGFLFFSRLIGKRKQPFDWTAFFISRIMRLSPVYMLAMAIQILLIFILSGFRLAKPGAEVMHEISHWLSFTLFGISAINDVPDILQINCGVVWSLVYEWIFYLFLPIVGLLFFRIRTSGFTVLIVLLLLFFIFKNNDLGYIHFITFLGGVAAAFLAKSKTFCKIASSPVTGIVVMACAFCTVRFFPHPFETLPLLLIALAFILIACGNTLFGLLQLKASRMLGQMAFTIYMFHGITLFVMFRYVFGYKYLAEASVLNYWLAVCALVPILISLCFLIHYTLERPAMKRSKNISIKLHTLFIKLGIEKPNRPPV